ncbi:MAG: FAD-dependent oxidoreductase [Spirosomataceae bacterium]
MLRQQALQQLHSQHVDVCIIGGGATGAGCALDAALRGLTVALIEKNDFASATSSRSTKLVHGGVRYLEQAFKKLDWEQFQMVRKGLHERAYMLNNAPHLAHPLALLTPTFRGFDTLYYGAGLKVYDWIAGDHNVESSQWLSKEESLQRIPTLKTDELHSAVLYYDGQFDDARYNLALVKTAIEKGCMALNYASITAFGKDDNGKLQRATIQDELTGEQFSLTAKVFINATGIFSDHIRQMANAKAPSRMRVSKGVHLVLPQELLQSDTAILVPKTNDGRVVFIIPWQGELLVGTTDTEDELSDQEPILLSEEVDYLLDYVNRYLAKPVTRAQVKSGFGGLRPLLQANPDADTKALVRDHEVEVDETSGLLSIMGGKWTTYRAMAKDTIDAVYEQLSQPEVACLTETQLLYGAEGYTPDLWKQLHESSGFSEAVCQHLCKKYGFEATKIIALMQQKPALQQLLAEGYAYVQAEVVYAATQEMACTLRDVLARRLGLELIDWKATERAIPVTAALMAECLGWTAAQTQEAQDNYLSLIRHFREAAGL